MIGKIDSKSKLIGKIDSKSKSVYFCESTYELYETIIELFTKEKNTVCYIYCNIAKFGGVATSLNRAFWDIEPV